MDKPFCRPVSVAISCCRMSLEASETSFGNVTCMDKDGLLQDSHVIPNKRGGLLLNAFCSRPLIDVLSVM